MSSYIKSFIVMLQFLTRIPLPVTINCDEKTFERGIYSFTLVGLLLGIFMLGIIHLAQKVFFGYWAVAIVAILMHVVATGGLHLDGVADSADGLLSNRSPERMLEIMKDSRIGSNGVLALIFVLVLKVLIVAQILIISTQMMPQPVPVMMSGLTGAQSSLPPLAGGDSSYWAFILMGPAIGRLAVVYAAFKGRSPRQSGMGNLFIGKATLPMFLFNILVIVICGAFIGFFISGLNTFIILLISSFLVIILTDLMIRSTTHLIGGITGDVLGAIIELSELSFWLIAFICLRLMM